MPTKSSSRDELVLAAIQRTGIGVREILRLALGIDPNNHIHRLTGERLIQAVRGSLPQNRAYYVPRGEKPLGTVALAKRLALAWFTLVPSGSTRIALQRDELRSLFSDQTPPGAHVVQSGPKDRPRVLLCYTPDTELVAEGILRVVERARAFPRIDEAMRSKDYGVAVLVPWNSGAPKLRRAIAGENVPGLMALRSRKPLAASVHITVERVATPLTLTQALKETAAK